MSPTGMQIAIRRNNRPRNRGQFHRVGKTIVEQGGARLALDARADAGADNLSRLPAHIHARRRTRGEPLAAAAARTVSMHEGVCGEGRACSPSPASSEPRCHRNPERIPRREQRGRRRGLIRRTGRAWRAASSRPPRARQGRSPRGFRAWRRFRWRAPVGAVPETASRETDTRSCRRARSPATARNAAVRTAVDQRGGQPLRVAEQYDPLVGDRHRQGACRVQIPAKPTMVQTLAKSSNNGISLVCPIRR